MEINPRHPIITELNTRIQANADDATAKDTADLLFDTALLNSGYSLEQPAVFAERINRMIKLGLNIDTSAEAPDEPEVEKPKVEEEEVKETEQKDEL